MDEHYLSIGYIPILAENRQMKQVHFFREEGFCAVYFVVTTNIDLNIIELVETRLINYFFMPKNS